MAVYKTAEGRYKVVLDDVVRAGAPRRRRSYGTFRTRKAAERKQQAILDSRERGEDVDAEPQTMQQLVDAYIRDREIRGRSPVTIHTYRKLWDVRLRDRIGHLDADTMRPMTLKKAYDDLLERGGAGGAPLSASTVHDVHGFVSAVLTWAKRLELVKRNVAESVEPPSVPKRRPTPYQPSEVERLILAAKDDRFLPLVLFVISTGLRRGELTALRWDDVDLERAQVHVRAAVAYVPKSAPFRKEPKTDRHRTVALGETALYALRRQRAAQAAEKLKLGEAYDDQGYVFAPIAGGMYSPNVLYKRWSAIAKRAGLSLTKLHSGRHSTASWLLASGVDVVTVAAILGHSVASTTTDIYGGEIEGSQRAAVAKIDQRIERPA